MNSILVIGSKGFIGSHAYDFFSNSHSFDCWGCDVAVDYLNNKYFTIDSSNSDFNEIFESHNFDFCLNCSGAASVPDSLEHPLRDFYLNTANITKILESIRRYAPNCKFINLSSAAVYGNPSKLPISEEDNCLPLSPYGNHKLMAEMICSEYHKYFGLSTCCLRIFSAYGPGLQKQLLWDIFKKTQSSPANINLFGTGNESRDFIYISDIIKAIECVFFRGKFDGKAYNVASGIETSVVEVANELLNTIGYKGLILFSGGNRSGDPLNWRANITRLQQIGFIPTVSIQQGITQYVQWLREKGLH